MSSPTYVSLTPKTPLHLGEPKPKFSFLPTQTVIPGSLIRGAVAEYFIKNGRAEDILSFVEGVRFGFFYPTRSASIIPYPLPASALECKSEGGFRSEKGHGMCDTLLATLSYLELKSSGSAFPVPLDFRCRFLNGLARECGGRMERVSGFYVVDRGYQKVRPRRLSQTKVAINRRRGTAEPEMLYSVTAIDPKKIEFVGRIWSAGSKIDMIVEALNTLGIGALVSRGYGRVSAKIVEPRDELADVKERVEMFNTRLQDVQTEVASIAQGGNSTTSDQVYFTIDLLSPAILKDCYNIPTLALRLDWEAKNRVLTPVLFIAQSCFVGGWSTAWGLPKTTTVGAGMGGTYVFKVSRKDADEKFYESLGALEREGVGERTMEGYGEVTVCHPLHLEVNQI